MNSRHKIDRRSFLGCGTAAASVLVGAAKGLTAAKSESNDGPVVETNAGKIRGLIIDKVYAFKGVPYGASTAGTGRFMPPAKPQPWTDIKETTYVGNRSPQQPGMLEIPEVAATSGQGPMGED
jgi:para-nitrobenzyl esterase